MNEEPQIVARSPAAPERNSLLIPIIAGTIFGIALLGGIWWIGRQPQEKASPPSAESLAYLPNIHLTDFHMSQADNMVGSNIVYLDGKVNNAGSKTVRHLRVRLYFYDTLNQLVLRDDEEIVRPNDPPLAAGATRDFQLRFDRLPSSWNYQQPQFQLLALELQ